MKFEEMELNIYKEYKENIVNGKYDGKVVLDELKSGNYLKEMECKKIEPALFEKVGAKIKTEMENGFISEIGKAPFFVRNQLMTTKYGDSVYIVNINNTITKSVSKKIDEIQKILGKDGGMTGLNKLIDSISTKPKKVVSKGFEM